ncbi:MAG: PKD domain-containing protein [Flavobacterium sp.]|nr:PKD domain-containing protein [Flavobacterium sp.]MBP6099885.1 PKD domain-containing protein [Flavobacterium sp.]
MKKSIAFVALFLGSLVVSCTQENEEINLDNIQAPTNIDATLTIKQDNSGKVTIAPTGEGFTQFNVYFGDATTTPATLNAGETIEHTYLEGTFQVKVVGTTLNGKTSEKTLPLNVTFFAPTNLVATITPIPTNSLGVTVQATANFETGFKVYFGENTPDTAVTFMEGETISHTYTNPGTYTIKVVAITGGVATTEYTQNVTVTIPVIIGLPLDFESATLPYSFTNFGGASTVVANNTNSGGINPSAKVGALTKSVGSQTWAGSFIELTNPINFTSLKKIKMKVWSPQSGIIAKMKLENLANANINIEKDANITLANGWQEITFDFTGISLTNTYQRVVVFFAFGNAGNGATYYFDDIKQSN